jgi:hypothetical protein
LCPCQTTSSLLTCFFHALFPQLQSQDSADVTTLHVEVTRAWGASTIAEADHVVAVLGHETSAQEAAVARDDTTLCIKDVDDWAALAEREALEWVSQVEAENSAALAFVHEDAEGLVRKIALLEDELMRECRARDMSKREHRACFEKLTLLQTHGSKLCHAVISPPLAKHISEGMRLAALRHTEVVGELVAFWAVVSSATKLVLGRSPGNTARTDVVRELVTEF